MAQYIADRKDIDFVLHEQIHVEDLAETELFADFNKKTVDMIVSEARNLAIKEILPTMFANELDPKDVRWMYDEMMCAPDVIAALALFDQSTRDYRQTLKDFPVPSLVCSGELSQQPLAGSALIVELVRDGRLEVFEGCGHALHFEDSEKFNRIVAEFASSL